MYTYVLNLRTKLRKALKEGSNSSEIKKRRDKFRHYKTKAFEVYSHMKACESNITPEYNILNGIDPPKPCENHTKKQCQDNYQKQIEALRTKVNKVTPIWNEVKNGHYERKNVEAMLKLLHYKKMIQLKTWAQEDCHDSKCDVNPKIVPDKPKKPLKCQKGQIKVNNICVPKPKCVPETKQTCIFKYDQKIRDNQSAIHDQIIAVDKLKKDKSKAVKLKEAQKKLLTLKKNAKL